MTDIQQIIANIIDRTLDEQEATSAPLSVSEIAAAVVLELGLVEERQDTQMTFVYGPRVRYATPWKEVLPEAPSEICSDCGRAYDGDFHTYCPARLSGECADVTHMPAEQFDELARTLDEEEDRGTIEERIAQEEARQRANPPAPGAMQGDAGPKYYKHHGIPEPD